MNIFKNLKINVDTVKNASEWFRRKVRDLHLGVMPYDVGHSAHSVPTVGHMYLFHYDAKFKYELPYWDRYPLVLPFSVETDRFTGLNLHYLPYEYRLQLLASLNSLIINSSYTGQKRMELSWRILKASSRLNLVKPCIHTYLLTGNHVRSKFLMIDSNEWLSAALLPVEDFSSRNRASNREKYISIDAKTVWKNR